MNSNLKVDKLLKEVKNEISKFKTIYEVRLFGSQITKRNDNSDVDLLVLCKNKIEYENILKYFYHISIKYKLLIHPIIKEEDMHSIQNNFHFKKNIIDNSIILFKCES